MSSDSEPPEDWLEKLIAEDKLLMDIYPLTIVPTRYRGTYEGGKWAAFNTHVNKMPNGWDDSDVQCVSWWRLNHNRIGTGESPEEAMSDLQAKVLSIKNGEKFIFGEIYYHPLNEAENWWEFYDEEDNRKTWDQLDNYTKNYIRYKSDGYPQWVINMMPPEEVGKHYKSDTGEWTSYNKTEESDG